MLRRYGKDAEAPCCQGSHFYLLNLALNKPVDEMKTITDIGNFWTAVRRLNTLPSGFPSELWWRGQPATSMDVLPSVFRKELFRDGWTEQKERDLTLRFLTRAPMRHPKWVDSDYPHCLAMMRHHGLDTRLLDWTESPLFALFFAVQEGRYEDDDAAIWAFCPAQLNQIEFGRHVLLSPYSEPEVKALFETPFIDVTVVQDVPSAPRKVAAVVLREVDIRMSVQLSGFTVHGDPKPLNCRLDSGCFMHQLQIPKSAKPELRKQLLLLGVRESNLFPDLDHLAQQLNRDARTENEKNLAN